MTNKETLPYLYRPTVDSLTQGLIDSKTAIERNMTDKPTKQDLTDAVWKEIATVEDPDIGLALTELGLIYEVKVDDAAVARIKMTLTSMGCPMGPELTAQVGEAAKRVPGIKDSEVEVVWNPPWDPEMASEDAKMELGIF